MITDIFHRYICHATERHTPERTQILQEKDNLSGQECLIMQVQLEHYQSGILQF